VALTNQQAPRRKVAASHLGAIVVLALGAWVHPALSATGADTRCDQSMDVPPMSAAGGNKLTMQVVDHGMNTAAGADEISLDSALDDLAPAASEPPSGPRVDMMLRRIFDEAQLRQPQLMESAPADNPRALPLAVDKADSGEEPAAVLDSEQLDVGPELPGYSDDELLRYRQQMFRKDI
jgi:hypothetical protein